MLTRMVATPWVKEPWPASRNHGFNSPPMPKPVAVPLTAIRSPSRDPVIVIDGRIGGQASPHSTAPMLPTSQPRSGPAQ